MCCPKWPLFKSHKSQPPLTSCSITALNGDEMTFPFFITCYAKNWSPRVTAAAHNMPQRLLCGEKASLSSFCLPYGTIVLVMLHKAPPPEFAPSPAGRQKKCWCCRASRRPWTQRRAGCGTPAYGRRAASWRNVLENLVSGTFSVNCLLFLPYLEILGLSSNKVSISYGSCKRWMDNELCIYLD